MSLAENTEPRRNGTAADSRAAASSGRPQRAPRPRAVSRVEQGRDTQPDCYSFEAEIGALGSLLIFGKSAADALGGTLSAEHYRDPFHAWLHNALMVIIDRGDKPSLAVLAPFLADAPPIDSATSAKDHLGLCLKEAAPIVAVADYSTTIRRCWMSRQMIGMFEEGLRAAANPKPDFQQLDQIDEMRERLAALRDCAVQSEASELEFAGDAEIASPGDDPVSGIVPAKSVVAIHGPSGAGKTFFVVDMLFCIAHGKPFMGRPTRQAAALYVPLEGQGSIGKRIAAARGLHGDPGKLFARLKTPITLGPGPQSEAHVSRLIAAGNSLAKQSGHRLGCIAIDTFARALAGANENDAAVISAAMSQATRISRETGATVILLHHPGKDRERGMRGSSALFAACDAVIAIERGQGDPVRTAILDKVKDGSEGSLGTFTLGSVSLGQDKAGNPITSCVLRSDADTEPVARRRPASHTAAGRALNELDHLLIAGAAQVSWGHARIPDGAETVDVDRWREACREKRLSEGETASEERAFRRARDQLTGAGFIGSHGGSVWLIRDRAAPTTKRTTPACPPFTDDEGERTAADNATKRAGSRKTPATTGAKR